MVVFWVVFRFALCSKEGTNIFPILFFFEEEILSVICAFLTAMVILTPNYNKMQVFYKGLCFYPVNIGIKKKKKVISFERGD